MNELIWQPQAVVVNEDDNKRGVVIESNDESALVAFEDNSIKLVSQKKLHETQRAYLVTPDDCIDKRYAKWGLLHFDVPNYILGLPDEWRNYEWLQNITEDLVILFNFAVWRNYPVLLYKVDTNVMVGVLSLLPEYAKLKIGIVVATSNKFDRIYWIQDKQ